jgi:putative NADH-flavin reductase
MKLTVVAATGRIGRLVVERALAAGHDVTAVVRNPANLPPGVTSFRAELSAAGLSTTDPAALAPAFAGADAVLSGLGPRTRRDFGVVEPGTRALIAGMRAAGARRLVIVSAAPVLTTPSPGRPAPPRRDPSQPRLAATVLYPIVTAAFRAHYADLAAAEDRLRDSGLEWTSLRPPRLTDKPFTGRYRTALDANPGGLTVSRADVADALLQAPGRPDWIGHAVGISV